MMNGSSQNHHRAMAHVERAIGRYTRDLALLTGRLVPIHVDLDDLALLDFVRSSADPRAVINDRMLRIKTLEATLELLREFDAAAVE